MANPWDNDPVAAQPGAAPWANDPPAQQAAAPAQPKGYGDRLLDFIHRAAFTGADLGRLLTNGATLGAADNIVGAALPGDSIAQEHEETRKAAARTGAAGTAAELIGGLTSGGGLAKGGYTLVKEGQALLPRLAAMGGEGGLYGAITGFNKGDTIDERLRDAKNGGFLGAGLGAGLGLGAKAVGLVASPVVNYARAKINPESFAQSRLAQALQRSGKSPEQIAGAMDDAAAAGQGEYTLGDALGKQGQELYSTVARKPGEGQTAVADFLNSRQAGQADRVGGIIDDALDTGPTARQTVKALNEQGVRDSDPLYRKAYAGGSIAPLESQLQDAFGQAAEGVSTANKALQNAQQQQLLARAEVSRAGDNVYSNAGALPAEREATAAVAQAQRGVDFATSRKDKVVDMLRQAQSDAATDAPGAVWSPRIQEFLDDPIAKEGLRRGVEVQRLEALAKGEPFDPTELAITGLDHAGDPIVAKVPNMRTIDAVKKGLDSIIEDYRDPVTRAVNLDQRGRAVDAVRRALLDETDRINPVYREARAAYAGPASIKDAVGLGQRAAKSGRTEDVADMFNGRSNDLERQGMRVGYSDKLQEGMERNRLGVNKAAPLTSPKAEGDLSLLSLFQGPQQPGAKNEVLRRIGRENDMFATRERALGGSKTADNMANESDAVLHPRLFLHSSPSHMLNAIGGVLHIAKDATSGNTEAVRAALAKALMTRDGGQDVLPMLTRLGEDNAARDFRLTTGYRAGAQAGGEIPASRQRKRK